LSRCSAARLSQKPFLSKKYRAGLDGLLSKLISPKKIRSEKILRECGLGQCGV
jgi:hypothetical protein